MRQEFDTKALADQLEATERDGIKKGIIKMLSFFTNYPRPAAWIKYIANGNSNLEFHYYNKWKRFCEANKTTAAAILDFYNDLDSKAEVRFIEYIATQFTK